MKQKVAIFDIDGTLFRWQLFHELVYQLKDMGFFDKTVSARLEDAFLQWRGLTANWSDYENEVVSAIEKSITRIEPYKLEEAAQLVVNKSGHKVYAYTAQLAKELKEKGYFLLAISGSQQEVVELFAKKHGFDACLGLIHERNGNKFTGQYERFVVNNKLQLAKDFIENHNLDLSGSYGIGDSSSDIPILSMVSNPIAFNPSNELLQAAERNNWPVVIERKNLMYRLEKGNHGYQLAETKVL
jgi:HAD superfamily hydrolase (TIGR01490 family)